MLLGVVAITMACTLFTMCESLLCLSSDPQNQLSVKHMYHVLSSSGYLIITYTNIAYHLSNPCSTESITF